METPQNRSKSKLRFNIFMSIVFMLLGVYLMTEKANRATDFNPTVVKGLGVLLIVIFAFIIILSIKRLNILKGK